MPHRLFRGLVIFFPVMIFYKLRREARSTWAPHGPLVSEGKLEHWQGTERRITGGWCWKVDREVFSIWVGSVTSMIMCTSSNRHPSQIEAASRSLAPPSLILDVRCQTAEAVEAVAEAVFGRDGCVSRPSWWTSLTRAAQVAEVRTLGAHLDRRALVEREDREGRKEGRERERERETARDGVYEVLLLNWSIRIICQSSWGKEVRISTWSAKLFHPTSDDRHLVRPIA